MMKESIEPPINLLIHSAVAYFWNKIKSTDCCLAIYRYKNILIWFVNKADILIAKKSAFYFISLISFLPTTIINLSSLQSTTDCERFRLQDKISHPLGKDTVHYPQEFLNTLNTPGFSSHCLEIKIGIPIIIMRNPNPPNLCNGTRL